MPPCLSPVQIDAYVHDRLPEDERRDVELHIESCAACHDAAVERELEAILPPEVPSRPAEPPSGSRQPWRIGPYRWIRELGRGGQARVYLMEDERLGRRVALKVLPPGFIASPVVHQRFRREAAALSRLEHPGISTVYETGVWEDCPFIAMRYVEGETLAARISARSHAVERGEVAHDDSTVATVHFIERVARALHVAHEAGLVHRDIKPSNIMITSGNEPVIVDFGLAMDEGCTDQSLTRSGEFAGTPAYMSPEQIRGERDLVDRRSDVFSLGVTLYEALTLKLPFDSPTTAGVFEKILSGRFADPSSIRRHLPKDLRVILETALETDRGRRYQSALAFAEDLRRYREHETILASPAGPILRLRRWAQRNPAVAVSLLSVFLVLTTALGITLGLLDHVRHESDVRAAGLRREEGLRLALQSSAVLRENPGQALLLAVEAGDRAPSLAANNALMEALGSCRERVRFIGHARSVSQASFSPDGSRVVTASHDGTARVWDALSGRLLAVVQEHGAALVSAEFSPDSQHVLTASRDTTARISDATSGAELVHFAGHVPGLALARYSPDGSRVLTVGRDAAQIWNASTGAMLRQLANHESEVLCARFSPDGTRVLTGSADSTAIVQDVASGEVLWRSSGSEGQILDARWSPSGAQVITASGGTVQPPILDGVARVWEASTGRCIAALKGHRYGIWAAVLSVDGERAATGGEDFTARVWDVRAERELYVLPHEHKVIDVDASPDGRRLATASYDRTGAVWDMATGARLATLKGHAAPLLHASFSPDGESVLTCSVDAVPRIWSLRAAWPLDVLAGRGGPAGLAVMEPGGRIVAAADFGAASAELIDVSTGVRRAELSGHRAALTTLAFSPDGRTLLTASTDATARLWSVDTGEVMHELASHTAPLTNAAFSGDGRIVATASLDHSVRIWETASGAEIARVAGPESPFSISSPSPDGRRVICGANDGFLCVADSSDGRVLLRLDDPGLRPKSAEWSPDGRRIVLAANVDRVRVQDAATGAVLGLLHHASRAVFAAYSPDGRQIATLCEDRIVRIWDARTLEESLDLKRDGVLFSATLSFASRRGQIAILGWDAGPRISQTSRFLVYPLDPMAAARSWFSGALTPDERDRFLVGDPRVRAARLSE